MGVGSTRHQILAPFTLPFADRLLTAGEVAARLRVSTRTVYALCEQGKLPHVRIMNSIRVSPSDLEAFLSARRTCRLRKLKGQDPLVGE